MGKFFSTSVHCLMDPCYESLALMFTKIYINIRNTHVDFTERTYGGIEDLVVARNKINDKVYEPVSGGSKASRQYQEQEEDHYSCPDDYKVKV